MLALRAPIHVIQWHHRGGGDGFDGERAGDAGLRFIHQRLVVERFLVGVLGDCALDGGAGQGGGVSGGCAKRKDRKRVEEGKRGGIGGCRIIKKKKCINFCSTMSDTVTRKAPELR